MQVKPIDLGGATVTLCTLHHAKTIRETKLAIGDTVLLEREVIPYFVEKTKSAGNNIKLPTHCNSCNTALEWDETETHLVCPNSGGCPNQRLSYLEHYVSRKVCNIMGIGSELIEKLVDIQLVKSPADFYKLTAEQILAKIPRQGETSAKKAIAAIQERREQTLAVFLQSLGIEKLGETVSERVAEKFQTLDRVLVASESELMEVEKVAEGIAKAVHKGLQQRKNLIIDLCKYVVIKKIEKVEGPLTGKSFCLTGHVEVEFDGKKLDSRPDIEDLIKAKGGSIKSVSKNLSFLIAGEGSGDKLDKAKKLSLKVIDGVALAKMLVV
jgi:DNA ligase (NAD+)